MEQVVKWNDGAAWDDFVQGADDATIMHLYGWKAVMEHAYGHRTFFLAALEEDQLRGVLPLTLVRNPILGRHLVSMPFMDYGGACTNGDENAEAVLVNAAIELAKRHHCGLVLRYLTKSKLSLPCSLQKVTMFHALGTSEEALWKRLPPERRNRIKKTQKHGLTTSFHGVEGLENFFKVFATNMRDLGSPVHSLGFFREVLDHLKDFTRIILVHHNGQPIGAGLMLLYNGMISIPWVSSLRAFFDKCPNQALYWEAMRYGIANGDRILDFGRSSRNSGTYEAKRQWGAELVQLHWYYYPEGISPAGADAKQLGWAANLWRRLPLPLANTIGPWLRRGIPN